MRRQSIVLASSSPRRIEMLRSLGLRFETRSPDVDETRKRASSLQIVAIGVFLALALLLRPRGLIGERTIVSRHLDE